MFSHTMLILPYFQKILMFFSGQHNPKIEVSVQLQALPCSLIQL